MRGLHVPLRAWSGLPRRAVPKQFSGRFLVAKNRPRLLAVIVGGVVVAIESELQRRFARGARGGRHVEPISPDYRAGMAQAQDGRTPTNLAGSPQRKTIRYAGSF